MWSKLADVTPGPAIAGGLLLDICLCLTAAGAAALGIVIAVRRSRRP